MRPPARHASHLTAGTAAQAALALSSKWPAAATQVGTPQVRTGTGARCARQLQPQLCHVIWQLAPLLQQLRRTSGLWQQRAKLLLHGCGASVVVWAYEVGAVQVTIATRRASPACSRS